MLKSAVLLGFSDSDREAQYLGFKMCHAAIATTLWCTAYLVLAVFTAFRAFVNRDVLALASLIVLCPPFVAQLLVLRSRYPDTWEVLNLLIGLARYSNIALWAISATAGLPLKTVHCADYVHEVLLYCACEQVGAALTSYP